MTDTTNPRARLDAALGEMRDANDGPGSHEQITSAATVACAEALSLLVDAHLATAPEPEQEPEPDSRESLPDDTPVGHGWVVSWGVGYLLKPSCRGRFTRWLASSDDWGAEGFWRESDLANTRPATVGDLRRVGLPVAEWPDITAPEPDPVEPETEPVEPPDGWAVLVNGTVWQRHQGKWHPAAEWMPAPWSHLLEQGEPTVIYTPKEQ